MLGARISVVCPFYNEERIVDELNGVQGRSMDIGGYYLPDEDLARAAMRPSPTLNAVIDGFASGN